MASSVECTAVEVDGRLEPSTCDGCEECTDQLYDEIDENVERGLITEEEAYDQRLQLDQFGIIP
jgi:hypothetical protein